MREGVGQDVPDEDRGQWLLRESVGGHAHEIKVNPFLQGRVPIEGLAEHCTQRRAGAWRCTVPAISCSTS